MYENLVSRLDREKDKRKRLHQALLDNITRQGTEMVSGRAVPYSPWTGLSQIGKAMIARKGLDESKAATDSLNKQFGQERDAATGALTDQYFGKEEDLDAATMTSPEREGAVAANPDMAIASNLNNPYTGKVAKAMMDAKSRGNRGAYSRPIQNWNPKTRQVETLMVDTRGTPGQNVYTLGGQPYTGILIDPKSPEAQGAASAAKAGGTVRGEDLAQSQIDLPGTEARSDVTVDLVEQLKTHPGMKDVIGLPDNPFALKGYMPGTDAANFRADYDQITGRTFMEIFPTLKGGGQITEVEGEKGQASINRMKTATTEKAFIKAADDFISEVNRLRDELRVKAGKEPTVKVSKPDDIAPEVWDELSEEDKKLWTN